MSDTPTEGRHEKTLLIRSEFLNHYGTLFGGYMMQWSDDMAYNAASLAFPSANFVTKLFGQFDFTSPVRGGDIIKIFSRVDSVGTTSCKIKVWVINARTKANVFSTFAVMVNVRDGKAVPIRGRGSNSDSKRGEQKSAKGNEGGRRTRR